MKLSLQRARVAAGARFLARGGVVGLVGLAGLCPSRAFARDPPPAPSLLLGDFGGEHIGASFYDFGGDVQFDCADGWVDPVKTDADGSFTATGTYMPIDPTSSTPPATRAARYRGTLAPQPGAGGREHLTLFVDVGGKTLGPFDLGASAIPLLDSCLDDVDVDAGVSAK
jgi:hypothetical protein